MEEVGAESVHVPAEKFRFGGFVLESSSAAGLVHVLRGDIVRVWGGSSHGCFLLVRADFCHG